MPNIWKLFEKQGEKKSPEKKNITELSAAERAEIEERTELGAPAREIADALGLDVTVIYNYRKAWKERQAAQASKPIDPMKDLLANKIQQREILKEDLELEKLKIGLERERQQMQMDQIRFKKEFEEWKREFNSTEDGEESDDISIKDLLELFTQARSGSKQSGFSREEESIYNEKPFVIKENPNIKPPHNQNSGSAIEDSQVTTDPDSEKFIDMTDEEIRTFIKGQEKKYIKMAKLLPDKILFDKIANEMPTLSDQSIDRAIQILKTEF